MARAVFLTDNICESKVIRLYIGDENDEYAQKIWITENENEADVIKGYLVRNKKFADMVVRICKSKYD